MTLASNTCYICLDTHLPPSRLCKHINTIQNYKYYICNISYTNVLLCTSCHGTHDLAREWFMKNHKPSEGFDNYKHCKENIGSAHVCIQYCSVHEGDNNDNDRIMYNTF